VVEEPLLNDKHLVRHARPAQVCLQAAAQPEPRCIRGSGR
jgi:hypothetical protein